MPAQAVVAGHVCLDVIPQIERHITIEPGRLYEVGPAVMGTGGPVSNTGVALHLLGIPTVLMGKLGDDGFGQLVLELFRRFDPALTAGMRVAKGETTSYSVVVNIPGADRSFLHCPGANHTFRAGDMDEAQIAAARLFHFGYPPLMRSIYANDGAELLAIYRRVKALGVTTSLDLVMPDPNGPSGQADWAGILARTLPLVDVFLPSADELLYMVNRPLFGRGDDLTGDEVSALGARLLAMGVAVAGVKLGARGLYLRTAGAKRLAAMGRAAPASPAAWADRELWFPVVKVDNFVGATGAGDATIAGFLAALLRGLPLPVAGSSANMVGAMNVQAADALSGLRGWDETQARLAKAILAPLTVTGAGWRFDPALRAWRGPSDQGKD